MWCKWCKLGFFCLFLTWLFGGHDGCESGDRGCDWCSGVAWSSGAGVVEVVCNMRMGVGIGSVGNRGQGVDRFPDGIFGELWEDLPCHLLFMSDIGFVFL